MDCVYLSCFIVAILVIGVHSEIATFNMGGVTGNISFTISNGGGYNIITSLSGLQYNYSWSVHQLPMFYNTESPCLAVGEVLHSFSDEFGEPLPANTQPYSRTSTLNDMVVDRSIVLSRDGSHELICAHIHRDTADVITAVATFQEPFAGTIMFRQAADNSADITTLFVDLYDTVAPIESAVYSWRVADFSGEVNTSLSPDMICDQVMSSEPFNPKNVNVDFCDKIDLKNCAVGDLTGKFSDLTVQPVASNIKYFFNDPVLPLSGSSSILQKILVLESEANVSSCAYVRKLVGKEVTAKIDSDHVQGSFIFRQTSPLDYTSVQINLHNMRSIAGGFHVHKFPVPQRFSAEDQICSDASVSGHFNPYDVPKNANYPAPANTTQDRYEVGDLSGKYGLLTGYNNLMTTYMDWNLPLYGRNSIIGRSVVIHFSSDGSRWVCGTIGYPGEVKTVYGKFQTPVVGSIMFRQLVDDPLSDTSVFIDVTYANGSPTTSNHNWHVHISKVGSDMMTDTDVCKSCKGHSNPFNVYLDNYSGCNAEFPMRCEVGDLSNKHGKLAIAESMNTKVGKIFGTDVQLPLSGFGTIESMSIVIHVADSGAPRMACTNLYTLEPKVLSTGTWTEGPANGEMRFTQNSKYDLTKSEINMQNLGNLAGGYHVHLLPVPMKAESPCSVMSVQNHFNPFNASTPANGTDDMYEVGDLSNKYGSFAGVDSVNAVYHDANLPLFGPLSVVGRSIVIHRNDETGSRWMCSTLEEELPEGTFVIEAESEMNGEMFSGYIKMRQVHYGNGLLGDTTIELSMSPLIGNNDDTEVTWHVTTANSGCHGDVETYNPYGLDVTKANYNEQCGLSSQLRCAVGDLALKHGKFSTSLTSAIFNDVNLDLSGRSSVIGHNIYLTGSSNSKISCSTLVPTSSTGKLMSLTFPHIQQFDAYDFRETLSTNVESVEMWQIVATLDPKDAEQVECKGKWMTVEFWILGENRDEVANDIKYAAEKNELGKKYSTCNPGTGPTFSDIICFFLHMFEDHGSNGEPADCEFHKDVFTYLQEIFNE
ncbi:uncharacterized protein LOC117105796 isoform X1 [Anneissia japonica]|uniref:uncharacterized protein LOC117105796 isoform X1 n=1 Tax=Anneissia japonica TaxID=1529436 RepID=UPI0014257C92|nr:uncharacterized protein LOC117105796 isoform X1 [Anneissia japonica]